MAAIHWDRHLVELIRRTATDLPSDVEAALKRAWRREVRGGQGAWALQSILDGVRLARQTGVPLSQDSGALIFYYSVPSGFDTNALVARTRAAVARATRLGYLRQNTFDPVSGAVFPTNVAQASPVIFFEQGARKTVEVRLLLKGTGSELMGRQYSLPDSALGANADLDGVRRCILDAVWHQQACGCGPVTAGVCIGGDRATAYAHATRQFLRKVGDGSHLKVLAELERRVLRESRTLDIGPIGLGGKSALLDVKIDAISHLPSCYFVTVAFMCCAYRRRGAVLGPSGGLRRWLY